MTNKIYTVITFSPVQGFIEKSRKLRDLYGSSYLLSYLSWVICNAAKQYGCEVISPALPNITQGMPNQIIIEGDFPEKKAEYALNKAWECVTETCREWIEENVEGDYTSWRRSWGLWTKYAWEFFWVQGNPGDTISDVREKFNEKKRGRDWTGINWQGESSTLSGADAIAYPKLGQIVDARKYDYQQEKQDVTALYKALSDKLGESFIDPKEELSIPELIKRMITYESVSQNLIEHFKFTFGKDGANIEALIEEIKQISKDLHPSSFKDLNRHKYKNKIDSETQQDRGFQGWFQGDGDKAGDYLKKYPEKTHAFSKEMRDWGKWFKNKPFKMGRVIYAGGDDFLGVFYDKDDSGDKLEPRYYVDWFSEFKTSIWHENKVNKNEQKKITVSVGFVWAFPGIPQRDVLQHCGDAEKSAKSNGRDRIAFRILFNNGNHLEWVCPWWLLEAGLLSSYRDREGKQNWTHIYNDVAVLESRHAFDDDGLDVVLGLVEIYFPKHLDVIKDKNKQLHPEKADLIKIDAGILGEDKSYFLENSQEIDQNKVNKALTNWIINLAKVGFHLCQQ
ncbi:MAG: CRISPR-associated protein [Tolypothrix brevis GSE-NOS-MK-07-07A]|jgi:CRISPR-associated protein Cmr2|nr:CRISPR-associated protein [Tolypothrix brevis GSE-NOS-MK-07-07A]